MKFFQQTLITVLMILGVTLHVAAQTQSTGLARQVDIENFGDPNLPKLLKKVDKVKAKVAPPDSVLRIVQLGDSHTAADIMTGQLREKLQQQFSDAGIGWITPMNVYGQRNSLISYHNIDWVLASSRSTQAPDYPIGGFIATPAAANAQLTINYKGTEKSSLWNVTLLVKQQKTGQPLRIVDGMNYESTLNVQKTNNWQYINAHVMLPFTIIADKADSVKLGGIWLEKNGAPGVTLSSIATNGAKQNIWLQWRKNWLNDLAKTKSDLVIIAYGTNESFESPFNIANYKKFLTQSIQQIRKTLPNSTILIISPPDTMLRSKLGNMNSCQAKQPPQLTAIRNAQLEVAKQQHTLYWSWQKVMGGSCSMENWVNHGLANKDYVHLTASGYQQSANSLYNALMELIRQRH